MIPDLTIVVPILKERENIIPFFKKAQNALKNIKIKWEIVFVDDNSQDGTAEEIRKLVLDFQAPIRLIQRIHRFGLSSACIEGAMSSQSKYIAVMDVDGQHDETLLPEMFQVLEKEGKDLIVGSRYLPNGSLGELQKDRATISKGSTYLAQKIGNVPLTDPMSGFFMIRRDAFEPLIPNLFGKGFKILLDLFLASRSKITFKEVPYTMRTRQHGESKLSSRVVLDYLMLLVYHKLPKWLSLSFLLFIIVGAVGAIFHLGVLASSLKKFHLSFLESQSLATLLTIGINFYFNNQITFYYQRLKGGEIYVGFIKFILFCSLGFAINLAVANTVFESTQSWWLAGGLGFFISGVWNYLCSKTLIWKR